MGWREFLRPTIGKIIISLLLLFIPFYRNIICPFEPPCFTEWYSVFTIFLDNIKHANTIKGIIFLLISIIISYGISSLITHIYKKIKTSTH